MNLFPLLIFVWLQIKPRVTNVRAKNKKSYPLSPFCFSLTV